MSGLAWIALGLVLAEGVAYAARRLWRNAKKIPEASPKTTPPGKYVVLFDGTCIFCIASTKPLLAVAKPGALHLVNFQEPGVLAQYPGVPFEACMRAMHLVTPSGRVYEGFAAVAHAVATRPVVGLLAYAYYLPGIHMLCDVGYALVAANRYRIMGKKIEAGECSEACAVHLKRRA